jgi:hypothetical protein
VQQGAKTKQESEERRMSDGSALAFSSAHRGPKGRIAPVRNNVTNDAPVDIVELVMVL